MKQLILTVIFCITSGLLYSQNISIKSFRLLPNDLDARVNYPVTDAEGHKCAIIKAVTSENGFSWDSDSSAIVSIVKKTGEYWIYISSSAKWISVYQDNSDNERYLFPENIQQAAVYELVLNSKEVADLTNDHSISTIFIDIKTQQPGADVYINEQYKGTTPYRGLITQSTNTYRIEKDQYVTEAGRFSTEDSATGTKLTFNLTRKEDRIIKNEINERFATVLLNSGPEDSARVTIDGYETNFVTPCKLDSIPYGSHIFTFRKEWFEPKSVKTLIDGESDNKLDAQLIPVSGTIRITTDDLSEIYIDSIPVGVGIWSGKLISGWHLIEVKRDRFNTSSHKLDLMVGDRKEIRLNPTPKLGSLNVQSNILGAAIKLNDKEIDNTPNFIDSLLIGEYMLSLNKEGYVPVQKPIRISENDTLEINETLFRGAKVLINSELKNVQITVDTTFLGNLPVSLTLNYGVHKLIIFYKDNFFLNELTVDPAGKNDFYLTTDDIFKGKQNTETFEFKGYDYAKAYFKNHRTSISYSYHNTSFKNSSFKKSIADGSINKKYGQALSFKFNLFPVNAEFTAFYSGFYVKNSPPFSTNNTIQHRGIEMATSYFPFAFLNNIYPYFGLGYQLSELVTSSGSLSNIGKASTNTSQPIFKAGLYIKISKIILQGEYKISRGIKKDSFNSDQYSFGIGIIL